MTDPFNQILLFNIAIKTVETRYTPIVDPATFSSRILAMLTTISTLMAATALAQIMSYIRRGRPWG